MSDTTNSAVIKITADASGVEAELRKVDTATTRTGKSLENLGRAEGINKLGVNAEVAASKFGFAGKTIIDAIQKQTAAAERGKRGTQEYFETWANQKGINPAILKPYLDQLDAVTRKTAEAAAAQARLDDGKSFLEGLRAQAGEIGKTNSQLLEMRAAQLGVSETAKPLIDQLREAEEASGGLGGALGMTTGALAAFAAGIAGAFSVNAIVTSVNASISSLAELDDMAQKTGSSVESLSRIQKVAAVAGQDFGAVDAAISKLAKGMGGLDEDSNKVIAALKRLGISTKDIATQDPSEVFVKAAKALQEYGDGAGKTALANNLIKGSGADLLPFMNDLAEGYDKYAGSSKESAAAASAFGDNLGETRVRVGALSSIVAANLLPTLVKFSEYIKEIAQSDRFQKFIADTGTAVGVFARAVESSVSVLVPAAKIAAAYFATFVGIPAAAAVATTALATFYGVVGTGVVSLIAGGTATLGFNTALFGTAVAANTAAGGLFTLKTAAAGMFAAFAGFQIGTYLREEFAEVRVAGLLFVEGLMVGFENIKFYSALAFDAMSFAWDKVLGTMKQNFAGYIDAVASGLAKIGATDTSAQVAKYAEGLRASGAAQVALAEKTAAGSQVMVKAHEATLASIKKNTAELVEYERTAGQISEAADRRPPLTPPKTIVTPVDNSAFIAKEAEAYKALTAAIEENLAATAREAAGLAPLTTLQKLQADLEERIKVGKLSSTAASVVKNRQALRDIEANLAVIAGLKLQEESAKNVAKAISALADDRAAAYASAVAEADANEKMAETFGMTKSAIEALTLARLEGRLAQRAALELDEKAVAQLERLIDAKKRSVAALGIVDAKEAAKKANTEMLADWKKTVDQYDTVFRNGFADMLNNGKDGFKSFTKSLVTTFKTSVADQIYKMFAQPFVMQIVGNLAGFTGGATGGAGGAGAGGALQLAQTGKSIYSAFATAASSGGGLAGFGKSLYASFTGAASAGSAATGASGAAAGASGGVGAAGAIPIAGWIAAGMALSNSLYKKGWDAENGSISKTGPLAPFNAPMLHLNTALQKLGLSKSLANMFSGASTVSRLFGRKNPEVTDRGIEGSFGGGNFYGNSFANVLEKGGVFRSDKRYTKSEAVSGETDSTFDETFKSLLTSVKGFGEVMGIKAGQIDAYTKQIKLTLGDDAAKNDELIAGVFGDIGNDLAKLLIPSIEALSEKGETAAATLQRIATGYLVMDEALAAMGDSFGAVGIDSLAARERLLELSGGLEAFSKGAAFFAQNYLTEAQRTEALTKQVTAAFADLGLAVPKTRAEFASLVLGTKKFTEEGAKTYAGLTNIQEAFAALTPELAKAAEAIDYSKELRQQEIQIMDLTGDKAGALAAARALELEGMDAILRPGQERINKLKDEAGALALSNTLRDEAVARNNSLLTIQAQIYQITGDKAGAAAVLQKQHIAALAAADPALRSAIDTLYAVENAAKAIQGNKDTAAGLVTGVDDAFAVLQRIAATEKARATEAHNLAMTRLQESIDAESTAIATRKAQAATAIASTKALSDTIRSTLSQMSIEGNEAGDRASAQAQVRAALAIARAGGPLPAADGIKDALSTLANISADQFASMEDFLRTAYGDKSDVSALGALADSTLSVQEQTLKVMEEQKSTLAQQKEAALLAYQGEVSRLDNILAGAQQQIDVLKGIDTTGLSIVQGLEAVRLAIVQAAANPIAGAAAPINDAYKESLGRSPDAAGLEYWKNAVASGSSTETVVSQIANSMEAQIQGLYKSLLGRSADAAGLAYFIKTGSSIGQIYQNITDSDEYKRRLQTLQAPIPSATSPVDRGGQAFAYGSDSRSSADVSGLLQTLIASVNTGNASTERLATMFDDVTEGGNGMRADIIATV